MTKTFGFGQPYNGIMQTAFVVEDIRASIDHFVRNCHAGPFFLLDRFGDASHVYRGAPSKAEVTIAMGFAGSMQIELIQPLDTHPSVYRETLERRGEGSHHFHHFGIAFEDCEAQLPAYRACGYEVAYSAPVPTGGSVYYLDNGKGADEGFLELIPANPGMDAHFTSFWEASRGWDGSDPIRPFM